MEGKIHILKKPAAGAARIGILYRSPPPLENVQNFRKGGGSVRNSPDRIEAKGMQIRLRIRGQYVSLNAIPYVTRDPTIAPASQEETRSPEFCDLVTILFLVFI